MSVTSALSHRMPLPPRTFSVSELYVPYAGRGEAWCGVGGVMPLAGLPWSRCPPSLQTRAYFSNKVYENCMPAGIKVDAHNQVYVSVPRWKAG